MPYKNKIHFVPEYIHAPTYIWSLIELAIQWNKTVYCMCISVRVNQISNVVMKYAYILLHVDGVN